MIFFATLAMTTILCDWKALVAVTLTVAVHHLVVGLLVPEWVFAGTSSLARILLNVVVLLAEAGALIWVAAQLVRLIEGIAVREQQQHATQTAHDEHQQANVAALEGTVAAFGRSFDALKQGDLTMTITAMLPDEYATLKANFNETLAHLQALIGSVSASAATISTGSNEIAQVSNDLARRTEANAASREETAASVSQMDRHLKASVRSASQTVGCADKAIATVSREVTDEAVQAMGRVSENAKGIDSVIEGLDKIAFQTRVLAMNAAVEAGRAGDAGRGFAVVADLVSALAMRAEEEAKRARDRLTVTQTDIVIAVDAVKKVEDALSDISDDVGQVHDLLATMAADNQAQSVAITHISAAIGGMDQATRQNAAKVDEASAATRSLVSQVDSLADQANRFSVSRETAGSRPALPSNDRKPVASVSPIEPPLRVAIPANAGADGDLHAF